MKTILVLAPHPELADAIRAGLNPEQYRIVHRVSVEDAEPLLVHGLADVGVLDLELSGVQGVWVVEKVRRKAPQCPLVVFAGARQPEWEEEAYLKGVKHVLSKPFRARLLNNVLDGLFATPLPAAAPSRSFDTSFFGAAGTSREPAAAAPSVAPGTTQSLKILRDFSAILTHSLNADALLKQFLLMIREITGVNRAAIFLRPSAAPFLGGPAGQEGRQMALACAIGLSPNLLDSVQLSFEAGIGGQVQRLGRILRRNSSEAMDVETQREFELLGTQVAIPVLDRERVLGVAVFDARVTGEPLVNAELELIFHLLEQVGLAVKNIWLHDQVAGNHAMLADVMRELSSACVVVSRDLTVLHANRMARKFFGQTGSRSGELEFSDLPAALGSKVFQVLKTGSALASFRYPSKEDQESGHKGPVYQVTITPVHPADSAMPASALLIVEDRTQAELLQKLETDSSRLKAEAEHSDQRRMIAEKLATDISNGLVGPLMVANMFDEGTKDPNLQKDLKKPLVSGVTRILRRVTQLKHAARNGPFDDRSETVQFPEAIKQAYEDAVQHLGDIAAPLAKLKLEKSTERYSVRGNDLALRFALMEIILNGLQAGGSPPGVAVQLRPIDQMLELTITDNGPGFTVEAAKNAGTPFWMGKKIVGCGLGIYVARKIIEEHGGKLEISSVNPGKPGTLKVSLPADVTSSGGEARISLPFQAVESKS